MKLTKLTQFICLVFLLLGTAFRLDAQGMKITGKVIDQKTGKPLAGVSVRVKNTTTATQTDESGTFVIKAPSSESIITITSIGYGVKEFKAGEVKASPNIELSETASDLNDVVVVGYGVQKRTHLTGSVATIDMKNVTDLPVGDMSSALKGQVVGVSVNGGFARPGESASLMIRNPYFYSKDGQNQDPLYVIDDAIRTEADFNALDASEIENISFLKDAASAIYGVQGANGVIIVKTKRGKAGTMSINYTGSYGVSDATYMPKMMNAYQQATFINDYLLGSNNAKNTGTAWDSASTIASQSFYMPDELEYFKKINYNWLDMAWQSAYNMRQALNISGGTDKATYFAGFAYNQNNSNFPGRGFKRYNFRSSSDIKLSTGLKLALSLSADFSDKKNTFNKQGGESLDNDWKSLINAPRFVPPYVHGLPVNMPGTGSNSTLNNYNYFAVHDLDNYTKSYIATINFQTQLSYDVPFLKGLKAGVNFNFNAVNSWGNQYGTTYKEYLMNGLGTHNHIVDTTGNYTATYTLKNGDRVYTQNSLTKSYQLNATLNYNRKFGKHEVSALFSYEQAESSLNGTTSYVDGGVVLGGYDNMSFALGTQTTNQSSLVNEKGRLAYIGRVDYNYANKYIAEIQFRADASQNFAPENRWGYFPSLSLGWVASEENFFKQLFPKINYFKIRGSIGHLGIDNTKGYNWIRTYNIGTGKAAIYGGNNTQDRGNAIYPNVDMANYDVTWDDENKYNAGIDAKFLNNRLSASVDGFFNHCYNMLTSLTSSPSILIGWSPMPSENWGKLNTFGIETSVTWKDRINKDWGYNVTLNFSWMDNKQLKVDQPAANKGTFLDKIGKSTDMGYYGYHCLGMFRTQEDVDAWLAKYPNYKEFGNPIRPGMLILQDVRGAQNSATGVYADADGTVDVNDQTYLKRRQDNHFGLGFNWGVSYKSLSLNVVMGLSWGGIDDASDATSITKNSTTYFANLPAFWADHWTPNNTKAKYPTPGYTSSYGVNTDFWWRSSTSFRVSSFNLSYTLPQKWMAKAKMNSVRLFLVGTNPVNFFNPYDYKDNANGSYNVYPVLKTYTFGMNVTL